MIEPASNSKITGAGSAIALPAPRWQLPCICIAHGVRCHLLKKLAFALFELVLWVGVFMALAMLVLGLEVKRSRALTKGVAHSNETTISSPPPAAFGG